jgi:porin
VRLLRRPFALAPRYRQSIGKRRRLAIGVVSVLAVVSLARAACADSGAPDAALPATPSPVERAATPAVATTSSTPAAPNSATPFGLLSPSWQGQNLLGDMWGVRPALDKYGVQLTILENVEAFGNLSGGVKQGWETNGLTTVTLQMDTEKAFVLKGGTLNVSGLQIWGGDLSVENLLVLQTLTDVEAPVGVRLWELWYQQKFGDKFDIRIGEQSLDEEFIISPTANPLFINSVSGFPALPAADLPAGGPAYPLAGLGVRGRMQLTDSVTVLGGVFNGSPVPRDSPNALTSNPHGVSFPLDTGTFAIGELQYAFGASAPGKTANDGPLPGNYKVGAWYDSYKFNDQQTDNQGIPLASPLSNGTPAAHHGNFSVYGVADQMIWRSKDDANRALTIFIRPMLTPYQDRNLVCASINAGLALHAPLPGRENDSFGVEMGTAWASNGASGFDRQMQLFQPSVYAPVRGSETILEATYQIQVLPSWQIQPDVQYFINPGLGIANPNNPTQRIKNEFVIGLRTNINF